MTFPIRHGVLAVVMIWPAALAQAEQPAVSFANDVAPILVDKCLACHNARTAQGRYSVENYASALKGGESGPAVAPGDAEFSNLVQLIEAGEMPKDGDPLPAEDVSLLKRWIAAGASLDEGKPADAPLASIMPKPP